MNGLNGFTLKVRRIDSLRGVLVVGMPTQLPSGSSAPSKNQAIISRGIYNAGMAKTELAAIIPTPSKE